MAPPFQCASIELDYPLYAVDFDREDSNRLVVAGGGGAGRSGVGNKISVLETVSQNELRVAGELELSRDEDSVMSLAMGEHKGKTTYLYAGVNSSPESIAKGQNEHLRTLGIEQSKARASAGTKSADVKVEELTRNSLFAKSDADTYQRLLRVSGSMGAAATAMGKEHQLAVFESFGFTLKTHGVMELSKEAEDLDIIQISPDEWQIAFCYKYELHVVNIGKEQSEPQLVFTMPEENSERPVFRSIRYLSPGFLMAASNLPKRSGVILQGFRLPTPGHPKARVAVNARVPRNISATALAITNLSPAENTWSPLGITQFVVAVAGHDSSISLFTLEHHSGSTIDLVYNLWPLYTLKDVHGTNNITGLSFSTFVMPKTHIRQQFIKLASTSLQKTVAVHSIALRKQIDKPPREKKEKIAPRTTRYVVALKSRGPSSRPVIITMAFFTLIIAIVGQLMVKTYTGHATVLTGYIPSLHGTLRTPEFPPAALLADDFLSKLSGGNIAKTEAGETLVIYEGDAPLATTQNGIDPAKQLQLEVHDPSSHGPGKTWEDLGAEQKEAWKNRLKEAGAWTQGMGESVFKGILFGEIAGAVGRAVAG